MFPDQPATQGGAPQAPLTGTEAPYLVQDEEAVDEEHMHYPPSSIWPLSMAAGITIAGAGLVTTGPVSFVGLGIMFISLVKWVQELRHEYGSESSH